MERKRGRANISVRSDFEHAAPRDSRHLEAREGASSLTIYLENVRTMSPRM